MRFHDIRVFSLRWKNAFSCQGKEGWFEANLIIKGPGEEKHLLFILSKME